MSVMQHITLVLLAVTVINSLWERGVVKKVRPDYSCNSLKKQAKNFTKQRILLTKMYLNKYHEILMMQTNLKLSANF